MGRTVADSGTSYFLLRALGLAAALALFVGVAPARASLYARHPGGRTVYVSRHGDTFGGQAELRGPPLRAQAARAQIARVSRASLDLEPEWCGGDSPQDDGTHGVDPALSQVKIVYAHPSDVPDHLLGGSPPNRLADLIQQDVRTDTALVSLSSGGTRTIRFDLGTSCGIRYVDIASVTLPHPADYYDRSDADTAADRVEADLSSFRADYGPGCANYGAIRCPRNFAVYLDGVNMDTVRGIADRYPDDQPGAGNESNFGGLTAIIFDPLHNPYRTVSLLHETSHTLGAVQDGTVLDHPPHASGNGHCWDERDVMCYDDKGPYIPLGGPQVFCDTPTELYDCDNDDYFAAHPAPGSYLATHWNVYDSPFVCALAACAIPFQNRKPNARFYVERSGQRVELDASPSSDLEGGISYAWDLDGDGHVDARTKVVKLTLPLTPAHYAYRLTVKDDQGATASIVHRLTVGRPPAVSVALKRALATTGKGLHRAGRSHLTRRRRVALRFAASTPGRLAFTVWAGRRVVATGVRRYRRAGADTLRLSVRRSAGATLKRRGKLKLTLAAAFRPRGAGATRRKLVVRL